MHNQLKKTVGCALRPDTLASRTCFMSTPTCLRNCSTSQKPIVQGCPDRRLHLNAFISTLHIAIEKLGCTVCSVGLSIHGIPKMRKIHPSLGQLIIQHGSYSNGPSKRKEHTLAIHSCPSSEPGEEDRHRERQRSDRLRQLSKRAASDVEEGGTEGYSGHQAHKDGPRSSSGFGA